MLARSREHQNTILVTDLLPVGGSLPEDVWNKRHRFLLELTWFHAVVIALVGPIVGYSWELSLSAPFHDGTVLHTLSEGLVVAVFAVLASRQGLSRTLRASLVGFGLVSSSAILVHLSGGYIELHFHFFVMLVFLALYQDWIPYGLAVLYVAIHHGVVGVLWPSDVYNHPAAVNAPWTWAGIHAFFVLCSCVGSIIAWRFNEKAYAQTKQIVDAAGEGIYGLDMDGEVIFANPAAAEMLGYRIEELIGRSMHDLLHHSRADGEECLIDSAFKHKAMRRATEEIFRRKDGTTFLTDYVCTPVFERAEMTGAVVTFRDVTESRRAQEEMKQRAREQEALNIIAKATSQSLRRDELLEIALDKVLEVTGRERVSIRLKDSATGEITLVAHRGFSPEEIEDLRQRTQHRATEQVLTSAQPLVINNRQEVQDTESLLPQSRAVAWIPMKAGAQVMGVLGISTSSPVPFSGREVEFLQAIGNMIGVALENARLFSETEARYRELETLQAISGAILSSIDLKTMMERILDHAFEIGNFDIGVVRLLDSTSESLEPVASRGYRDQKNVQNHLKKLEGYTTGVGTASVMQDKAVHVVDLTQTTGMRTFKKEAVSTIVSIPLRSDEEVLGVIQLGSRTPREFRESELRILDAIGGQAGIAIQKARLYEETKRAQTALEKKAEELARSNIDLQRLAQENKLAKEKLQKANSVLTVQAAELVRSNTELEQFAYVASHDLQEPLRMVASYVQLLARRYKGKLDTEADEFIAFAVDGSKRMQELINALLAYSRIGTKGKEFEPTDCEAVFVATLKNLQIAIDDGQATIAHDPLPTVIGDATQLGQLFQNLIGNAIKFRGHQRPNVQVSAERNGKEWLFAFRDDGIGIDPEYSERVFVIFQRLHSKEEYPGTGIGLALCKKIVERHGGRIWVESVPGRGSTFRFTIPTSNHGKGNEAAKGDEVYECL